MFDTYYVGKRRTLKGTFFLIVLGAGGWVGWKVYTYFQNQDAWLKTEMAQIKVEQRQITEKITQAANKPSLDSDALKRQLSAEFRAALSKQKLEVLASVEANFKLWGANSGSGTELRPNIYQFPSEATAKNEPLLKYFIADVTDPKKPFYQYETKQIPLKLTSTLNFDEKNGTTSFWTEAQDIDIGGKLHLKAEKVEFRPSERFTQWATDLRTKRYDPQIPKYSVNLLMGYQATPGHRRTVYGLSGTYYPFGNLNVGVGGGVLGDTVFVQGGFHFGSRK